MLAAGARRAVRVDLQVVGVDLDLPGVLDDGRDLDAGERRLAPVGGVERAEAHEAVHALLGRVQAVGVLARGAEGRGLDAGLLPRAHLEQLDLEAAPLGPAHLHAQHHLRPVLGVGAAGARVHGHERVARVVAAGEQALLLELGEALLDGRELLLEALGQLRVLLGELGEALEVLGVGLQRAERLEAALQARVLGAGLRAPGRGRPRTRARPSRSSRSATRVRQLSRVKDSPRAA